MYRLPDKSLNESVALLDNIISTIFTSYKNILILGDIIVNLFNIDNHLRKCLDDFGLVQIIDEPIHLTDHSETLIDPNFKYFDPLSFSHYLLNISWENTILFSDIDSKVN